MRFAAHQAVWRKPQNSVPACRSDRRARVVACSDVACRLGFSYGGKNVMHAAQVHLAVHEFKVAV
jgi:hypothetical protein